MNKGFIWISDKAINFFKRYRLHFILWSIYIAYESILIGFFYQRFGKFENYATHYTLNIILFYVHFRVLTTINSTKNMSYMGILGTSIIEILIYIPVLAQLNQWFTDYNQSSPSNYFGIDQHFVLGAIYRSLFFILVSTGFWFLNRYLTEKQLNENAEKARLEAIIEKESLRNDLILAKNAFIRAQINPHFLFNTLSFIHRRIYTTDELAGELLTSLSKMMRYAIGLDQGEIVTNVSEEVHQVENLIHLFQLKENYNLFIFFDYTDDCLDKKIIPLALLTLSENIFKHGVIADQSNPAVISVSLKGTYLQILTKNLIADEVISLSSGTGLKNLGERIRNHYGDDYNFIYGKKDEYFQVELSLPFLYNNQLYPQKI